MKTRVFNIDRTKALRDYMAARAKHEGVAFKLDRAFFEGYMRAGIRWFFGVTVANNGALLSDVQQPEFFQAYHRRSRNQSLDGG